MADLTTMAVLWGGPWLLGTALICGTTGMAVTAGVRAVWRRVRPPAEPEPLAEPERSAGPGPRLCAACLAAGRTPAEAQEALARDLVSPTHLAQCGLARRGHEAALPCESLLVDEETLTPLPGVCRG